jgi:hypothetical protein
MAALNFLRFLLLKDSRPLQEEVCGAELARIVCVCVGVGGGRWAMCVCVCGEIAVRGGRE